MGIDETIKDKLVPVLKKEGLDLLLLFGSVASGKMRKESDVDLAFLFDRPVDILALTNRIIKLLHINNVDVVDLKHATPVLKYAAARNGRLLYESRGGLFNDFYSLAFSMYIDSKKLRDAQRVRIARYLKTKGLA